MRLIFALALLLLCSCSKPITLDTEVRLSFLHLPEYSLSRTVSLSIWDSVGQQQAPPSYPVYLLELGGRRLLCTHDLAVYDEAMGTFLVLTEEARKILMSLRDELHELAFAVPVPWKSADRLFSRMNVGEVRDLVTGQTFRVQRRGGTHHADVQPLSKEDTAIMKEIYGGSWSWDRRAIILTSGEEKIAASMNGMPHGQGALQNNFSGHFCIHFLNSTTHGSRDVDLGHMLMIAKAAGSIWDEATTATPEQQMRNFVAAFNQKDMWLTGLFASPEAREYLQMAMEEIATINLQQVVLAGPAYETCELEISLEVIYHGGQRSRQIALVTLIHLDDRWSVDASFLSLLSR